MGGTDTKRIIATVVIIGAIWMVWMKFFLPKPAPSQAPAPSAPVAQKAPAPEAGASAAPAAKTEPSQPAAAGQPEQAKPAEQRVTLEGKQWKATFSTWGGTLAAFE